jgi:pilus assembly protein Flp/PilA
MTMNLTRTLRKVVADFSAEEDGGQIVEYGLIIAVVSLGLILLLKPLVTDSTNGFQAFVTKVTNCLSGASSCT